MLIRCSKAGNVVLSRPLGGIACHSLETATQLFLRLLYFNKPIPQKPVSDRTPRKLSRNEQIRQRYADGETIPQLAQAFGISNQRVHQIIHGKRK